MIKIAWAHRASAICSLQELIYSKLREKSFDYLFMMYMKKIEMVKQKKRTGIMQSGKSCAINCTTQDTRLIWKQENWLVLTKPYCLLVNHNPEFWCEICTGNTPFSLCYTSTAVFSANQNGVIFSWKLLIYK